MTDILDYKAPRPRPRGGLVPVTLVGTRRELAILSTLIDYYMEANPAFDNQELVDSPTGAELRAARSRFLRDLGARGIETMERDPDA